MELLCLGRGKADEHYVSDFAAAAYRGNFAAVKDFLEADQSLKQDPYVLYVTLRGGHADIFSYLVDNGVQIQPSIYTQVLSERPEFIELLPPNPTFLKKARASVASRKLSEGLLTWQITVDLLTSLFVEGADPNEVVLVSHGASGYTPLHLASRNPDPEIISKLLFHGAKVNALTPEGMSPLRLVLDQSGLGQELKEKVVKVLLRCGGKAIPSRGVWEKLRLKFL